MEKTIWNWNTADMVHSYKYLKVRIDEDSRDLREIRERIGQGRRTIKPFKSTWWHGEIKRRPFNT